MKSQPFYEFGPFRLDPAERRLVKGEELVSITPKCFDLLTALVENSGHLLEKEVLLERVWPNQFVEESNLSFNISALRKALGEGHNGQRYIETVPKKGFRFVAPVTIHDSTEREVVTRRGGNEVTPEGEVTTGAFPGDGPKTSDKSWLSRNSLRVAAVAGVLALGIVGLLLGLSKNSATPVETSVKTLAVLPFKPVSKDSGDESLEMGMAETLVTRLSSVKSIVVRPMAAVRQVIDAQADPIKVGKELQTEAVLDGSIQKAGDRLRVTVRLMNVQSGATLWTEQFDENFTDIFKVQDSIAGRVTNSLLLKLSTGEQQEVARRYTDNTEAYLLYLQGDHLRSKRDFRKSLEFYQSAIEKDPNFSLAYIGVARCYINLTSQGRPNLDFRVAAPKVKEAANKALQLNDSLPEAYSTRAEIKYQFDYDWIGAEQDFQKAIELNPNSAAIRLGYGWFLMMAQRFDEALPQMESAQRLEPGNFNYQLPIGVLFYFSRDYDKALARLEKVLEVEPNFGGTFFWLSNIYQQKQKYAEAVDYSLKQAILNGRLTPEQADQRREVFKKSGWIGYLRMRQAEREEDAKKEPVSSRTHAVLCALLGEKDKAFAWIDKAIDEHDPFAVQLKVDPQFDSLRSDPRYATALRRVNMTP